MLVRTLLLSAFASLALPTAAPAAQVCEGNVTLSTPADVSAFVCTEVTGNLLISNSTITNLAGLSELTSVGGSLDIRDNAQLANVDGLSALISVGGNFLQVFNNAQLANVDGLSALTSVGRILNIGRNDALLDVDGLSALASVGGDLRIFSNAQLANVGGLSALTSVGDELRIFDNAQLANVDGLRNLASVTGQFGRGLLVQDNAVLARCAVGLGPILTANEANSDVIGFEIDETNSFSGNGTALAGGTAASDCNSAQSILDAFAAPPPVVTLPLADVSLTVSGGALVLPAGRGQVRVTAGATFTGETGQRFTVFVRLDGPGGYSRIAKRGEIKPAPGGTMSQSIKFGTRPQDPAGAYTVTLLAAEGSVPMSAAGDAEVLATLPATKLGGAGLRTTEALAVYPNPAASTATLRFGVAEAGPATLAVYDALGREVARPVDGHVEGTVEASFDASALPAGLYVARLKTPAGTETVRLTVVR